MSRKDTCCERKEPSLNKRLMNVEAELDAAVEVCRRLIGVDIPDNVEVSQDTAMDEVGSHILTIEMQVAVVLAALRRMAYRLE